MKKILFGVLMLLASAGLFGTAFADSTVETVYVGAGDSTNFGGTVESYESRLGKFQGAGGGGAAAGESGDAGAASSGDSGGNGDGCSR